MSLKEMDDCVFLSADRALTTLSVSAMHASFGTSVQTRSLRVSAELVPYDSQYRHVSKIPLLGAT